MTSLGFTAHEAKNQLGIELPDPEYMIKLTLDNTRELGYRLQLAMKMQTAWPEAGVG